MELTMNIWFIVDIKTGLSKYCIIRPYNLDGTDETKLTVLKYLADSDFVTEEKFEYTQNATYTKANGEEIQGYLPKESINIYFKQNINFFASAAEFRLSKIRLAIVSEDGCSGTSPQKLPKNLLHTLTFLMENEYGEMRPYTIPKNIAWYEKEKARINKKFE